MDAADLADGRSLQVPLTELAAENAGRELRAGGTCRWRGAICTVDYIVATGDHPRAGLRLIGR